MQDQATVRAATAEDVPGVAALRQGIGWSSGGLDGAFAAAAAGRQQIFVAQAHGKIIGAVVASFTPVATAGPFGHVSDLLVAPLWRRRGVGGMLLDAAEMAIHARGLRGVTLDVDASNAPALRLYAAHGYRRHRPAQFPWGPGHTLLKTFAQPAARPMPRRPARPATFIARLLGRH